MRKGRQQLVLSLSHEQDCLVVSVSTLLGEKHKIFPAVLRVLNTPGIA